MRSETNAKVGWIMSPVRSRGPSIGPHALWAIITTAILAVACSGFLPTEARAAPTTSGSPAMSGSAASVCTLSANSVSITYTKTGGAVFSPSSVTVLCNRPAGATLSIQSERMKRSGQNTFFDHVLSVNGWTSPSPTYTTAASPPAATTSAINSPISKTITFMTNFSNTANDTFTSSITLGLTQN